MGKRLHVLTNSELETWRTCRARWGFEYADMLRPEVEAEPLAYGSIYHLGIAAGWRTWAPGVSVECAGMAARAAVLSEVEPRLDAETDEERAGLLEEWRDVASFAVVHYFEQSAEMWRKVIPLAVEAPFQFRVPNNAKRASTLALAGVLDLLVWEGETGRLILEDSKSTSFEIETMAKRLPLVTQPTGYWGAIREALAELYFVTTELFQHPIWATCPAGARDLLLVHAWEIRESGWGSTVFAVSRKKAPSVPKVNKDGRVSAAQIDTLPEIYERALLEQEPEVTDKQRDLLARLKLKTERYLGRLEFYRGPVELERWRKELWVEARQMRAAERDPALRTRNPSACTGPASPVCPFSAVCQDPDNPLARAQYRRATARHEEVEAAHGNATRGQRQGQEGQQVEGGEANGGGGEKEQPGTGDPGGFAATGGEGGSDGRGRNPQDQRSMGGLEGSERADEGASAGVQVRF